MKRPVQRRARVTWPALLLVVAGQLAVAGAVWYIASHPNQSVLPPSPRTAAPAASGEESEPVSRPPAPVVPVSDVRTPPPARPEPARPAEKAEPKTDTTAKVSPPAETKPVPALPRPVIPRHYPHIRIAMLAYAGNPMGAFEDRLLRESVDLVVPNVSYLKHIHAVAPKTPQLIYTNTSNLYLDLLTDWLQYADANGLPREAAFYHAAAAKPFRGDSPSSLPVTWFWNVQRGGGRGLADLTAAARGKGRASFGEAGESLYAGHPDRFREINLNLVAGARGGWSARLEYAAGVDERGRAAAWKPLPLLADTTAGLARGGQVTFDPPADWKPVSVGGSPRLYHVRFRTTAAGTPPVAGSILGRDYVGAHGTTAGVIPAFDSAADANGDGYLDDAEYARRAPGKDARFVHESRMLTESYGQMRFYANPSSAGFRQWAVAHHARVLEELPLAGGFFMDNSEGKVRVRAGDVVEPLAGFATDYGAMLAAVSRGIAPRWVLANTAGGYAQADPVLRQNPAYFEEFGIRPLADSYVAAEDIAGLVARRAALATPPPLAVIDSYPQGGKPDDARTQLATLAYYYLLADPETTFLMMNGGNEPGTTWSRHWTAAVTFDVGRPAGKASQFATGADPGNGKLSYRVYQRPYERALVLYKPLSYVRGSSAKGSLGEETATRHDLPGMYRPLRADGSLGEAVTSVSLRNGEGAVLVKGKP
jgi:hypothetical protein